jgi:acylpyruvate hydrolase
VKLLTFRTPEGTRAGRVEGDEVVALPFADVGELLAAGALDEAGGLNGARHPLAGLDLAPVVARPGKVICIGLNYASHAAEIGAETPSHPTVFAKYAEALIGAADPILLAPESSKVDWEVELAFVIGRSARRVPAERAVDHIAGYTILNDVSMRDWQFRTGQFLQGKTFEATTPVGPWLVTGDELDPADLAVRCLVDDEVVQEGRTSDLVFAPAELVAYLSTILTLQPGDLIATGTPSGVGMGRTPERYLQPGQVVRTEIEGIGAMVNRCEAEAVAA